MRSVAILLAGLILWGCPAPQVSTPAGDPVEEIEFSYLQDTNQLYFAVALQPDYFPSRLDSVLIRWTGTDSLRTPDVIALNDSGLTGDILPGDNRYSRKVSNSTPYLANVISSTDTGRVYFQVRLVFRTATDQRNESRYLGNLRPVILRVTGPDTAVRPSSGFDLYLITCQVHDANGLDDIRWVGFRSYHTGLDSFMNGGNPIYLYDDGGSQVLYEPNITSGDSVARDGIYSFQVALGTAATTGTYHWIFEAVDLGGEKSRPVTKQVVIQ